MKKYLMISLLLLTFASCSLTKKLLFQIGPESKRLLVEGKPFDGSATTFWKMWPGMCTFNCTNEKVLVINLIVDPSRAGIIYGTAVFIKAQDNYWYQAFFESYEEINALGGIIKINGSEDKIKVTYKSEIREYPRLDVVKK